MSNNDRDIYDIGADIFSSKPIEQPVAKPVEQPTAKSTEQPVAKSTEQNTITVSVLELWESAFLDSTRGTAFGPSVADALRDIGVRISELEDFINDARRKDEDKRTSIDKLALTIYKSMLKEIEHAKRDALMSSAHGVIFSLKAVEKYEDKQVIKVEEQSLSDVIAQNSKQKK